MLLQLILVFISDQMDASSLNQVMENVMHVCAIALVLLPHFAAMTSLVSISLRCCHFSQVCKRTRVGLAGNPGQKLIQGTRSVQWGAMRYWVN